MRIDLLLNDVAAVQNLYSAVQMDAGLRTGFQVKPAASWEELESRAKENAFDLALVQPSFPLPDRRGPDGVLRLLLLSTRLGPGRLILFICGSPSPPGLLKELQGLPAPIILVKGVDDGPRTILRAIARSWIRRLVTPMPHDPAANEVDPYRESALTTMVGWPPPSTAPETARRLHLGARTHRRQMSEAGYPSPSVLIRWGRLLEAVVLWRMGMRSSSRITGILGLGRTDALSALARSLTGNSWKSVLGTDLRDFPIGQVFGFEQDKGDDCA